MYSSATLPVWVSAIVSILGLGTWHTNRSVIAILEESPVDKQCDCSAALDSADPDCLTAVWPAPTAKGSASPGGFFGHLDRLPLWVQVLVVAIWAAPWLFLASSCIWRHCCASLAQKRREDRPALRSVRLYQ